MLAVLAAAALAVPSALTVAGPRGEQAVPVRMVAGSGPMLPAPALAQALGGSIDVRDPWVALTVGGRPFRFLLGAPLLRLGDEVRPLATAAVTVRDTAYVPFQFAAEVLPAMLGPRFRYDAAGGRLVELAPRPEPEVARLPNGLRPGHSVTIDPGHGGVDPGNPGLFFPGGLKEKDVTLAVGLLLRDELRRQGVAVRMTRAIDTLIDLRDRGAYCGDGCDLFVSLHVNALPRRRGYTDVSGFETYFLAEAKTEESERVARMENEALRFEAPRAEPAAVGGLDFILKDLQLNEHLRESARAAELVQVRLGEAHHGPDRGVKQAGFMVLTTARRPAILVEMGYSTNPRDARLMTTRAGQQALASAIAAAVVDYLREYERKVGAGG